MSPAFAGPGMKADMLQWSHVPEDVECDPAPGKFLGATQASMEPRPGGRGMAHAPHPDKEVGHSFNGATSRRTWNVSRARRLGPRQLAASMEPRPGGRGMPRITCHYEGQLVGFNGATSRRTWNELGLGMRSHGDAELQWSHVPEDVECPTESPAKASGHRASMEPRPGGRGM